MSEGNLADATIEYDHARTLAATDFSVADIWNDQCWDGSLWGHAAEVIHACEQALSLYPDVGSFRDSRGLALALSGELDRAAEDFQYYADNPGNFTFSETIELRKEWVRQIKNGRNPIDEATLEGLRQ